jgi:hypothetical protein
VRERADAPVQQADVVRRRKRHRRAGGARGARGAQLHAARIEPVHEERAAQRREERRLHLHVVHAHVEIGPVDDDELHAKRPAEAAFDAFDLRALAERVGQAAEHELRATRRVGDPVAHAHGHRDQDDREDEDGAKDAPLHHQKAIVTEKARRNLRSRSA